MINIYKNLYSEKNKLNLSASPRITVMLKMVNDLKLTNANILDFGCYDGTFLSNFKGTSNKLVGIEASDYGVTECKKIGLEVVQYFYTDDTSVPFEAEVFDIVIAGEIIEHIYDTDHFLGEIKRILKPGGFILISTPNIATLGRRLMLLFAINPLIELSPNEVGSSGHIRYFTFSTLRELLDRNGYDTLIQKSDIVNFTNDGKHRIKILASLFPALGQSVICLGHKR